MSVFVLGGFQTDFAANSSRSKQSLADLVAAGAQGALESARVDAREIEVGHVGNFAAELFVGQGHLGGLLVEADRAFVGVPTSRHEGACASGSLAVLAAMADIEAGRYDVALVLGVEMMRNVPGDVAASYLGAAAWHPRETEGIKYIWPSVFSALGDVLEERSGMKREHCVAIAKQNFENARRNPNAQTRRWTFDDRSFADDDEKNPVIVGRIRRQDCGQITDGSAAVILASDRFAREHAAREGRDVAKLPVIRGWGHRTARMAFADKLEASHGQPYLFPEARRAITDAYARAKIGGPSALSAIETHDCFSTTHYLAIDHFGITAPGEAFRAIEDGTVAFRGTLPMNPSGGLMGGGHPVGATGVRMLLDASKQVAGRAGDCQVDGAHTVATFNLGGSATTCVSLIVGRAEHVDVAR